MAPIEGTCSLALFIVTVVAIEARVAINAPTPSYVLSGQDLVLTCTSDKGRELVWVRETPKTSWQRVEIEPQVGGDYITRYTIEKPTNLVNSTLIKKNVNLEDRGMYECRDTTGENSFALWVTVLYIAASDVTAKQGEDAFLNCVIRGFDSNIPYLEYHWYYMESTIQTNHKYDIVSKDGLLQLTINKPENEDGGVYMCSFTLQTNHDPVTFSATVTLNTDDLIVSGTTAIKSRSTASLVAIAIFIAICFPRLVSSLHRTLAVE